MADAQLLALVRPFLRGRDTALVAVDALEEGDTDPHTRERVLAVISSTQTAGSEEGCVFVFKRDERGRLGDLDVLPITHDFQLALAQVAHKSSRSPTSPNAPRVFSLTAESPSRGKRFRLVSSSEASSIEALTSQCKRLRAGAEAALAAQPPWTRTHHLTTSHSWVQQYRQHVVNIFPNTSPTVHITNRTGDFDMKLPPAHLVHPPSLQYPIEKRLSKMSAGFQPSDVQESLDLELLQDDWVRRQLNKAARGRPGHGKLKLRICSFNVNGQEAPLPDYVAALGKWIHARPEKTTTPTGKTASTFEPSLSSASVSTPDKDIPARSDTMMSQDTLFSAGGDDAEDGLADKLDSALPLPRTSMDSTTSTATIRTLPTPTAPPPTAEPIEKSIVADIVRTSSPAPPLSPELDHHDAAAGVEEPDLLVVSFQELDLSTGALMYATDSTRDEAWTAAIITALGHRADGDEYVKVASKQLVGMLVILISTKSVRPRIRDIRTSSVGVGIMGLMGNKGAVGLRVRVDGSTLTFVCAHLAAFDEQHARRDADFVDITRRLTFSPSSIADVASPTERLPPMTPGPLFLASTPADIGSGLSVPGLETEANTPMPLTVETDPATLARPKKGTRPQHENPLFDPEVVAASVLPVPIEHLVPLEKASIWDCDALFWSGDFNYRLELPDADVRELLNDGAHSRDKRSLAALLRWDQLKTSQRNGTAFVGFTESDIHFLPTYRFESSLPADANGYDTKRKPAWTDRILHMASDLIGLEQTAYEAYPEVTLSDHKPISADFEIETDSLSITARHVLMQTLLRRAGDWAEQEDGPMPKVEVSPGMVDFGVVEYEQPATKTVTVKNTGKVPCGWRFIPPTPNVPLCAEWLDIQPPWGVVMPGDIATITMTIHVTSKTAPRLNTGTRKLEDTLILHAMRGKDYFVAVSGNYQPTCFATDLRWLARLPGPIREYFNTKPRPDLLEPQRATNAPMEIMNLISWLMMFGLESDELFLGNGNPVRSREIRNALDLGTKLEDILTPEDAWSVADVLLTLLESLPSPVVPFAAHASCTQVLDREGAFELVHGLPPLERNVLMSLASFLHFFIEQTSHDNKPAVKLRKIHGLAAIFTPILLRDDPTATGTAAVSPLAKRRFIVALLQT